MKARQVWSEVLASVVVFLVALPLCMGVAIASGVPPAVGLVSGIVGGLVVGFLAGSPLQVTGPAAGLIVIVYEIVQTHGIEALGPIVLLAGILQAISGKLGLGQWFRAVTPAVIYGMLAGIGVLIFSSQFHVMIDDTASSNGLVNLVTIPAAIAKAVWPGETAVHGYAGAVGALTLVVLVGWNALRERLPGLLKAIPAPLLAVGSAVGVAAVVDLPIAFVTVPDSLLDMVSLPTPTSLALLAQPAVLGSALALAVIASAEALLCAIAVDKLHDGDRGDLDRELFAQGMGNVVAGSLGALPVTGVIVRSTANVQSGGKTRLSVILQGLWLLAAVAVAPFVLKQIPVASLAAVLVYIGWRLVDIKIPRDLLAKDRGELGIYAVTVGAIVSISLLEGLLIGVALSVMKLAWTFSHLDVEVEEGEDRVDLRLTGSCTFVGLPRIASALHGLAPEQEVHVHVEDVDYVDHACFELLSDWRKDYETRGGYVVLEWDTLAARGVYRARGLAA